MKEYSRNNKLIVDGNLLARKSFYKFSSLSCEVSLKELGLFSKKIKNRFKNNLPKREKHREIISEGSGNTLKLKQNGKIEKAIHKLSMAGMEVTLNTSVLYGMLRSILLSYEKYNMGEVVICYDPIFKEAILPSRKEINSQYKNRIKDPITEKIFNDALFIAQSFFYKAGVTQAITSRFEADDLMQYYSEEVFKFNNCILLTEDHDLYQLLEKDRVTILKLGKNNSIYTEDDFRKEYGISPKQWREVLALGGCSTDNVKGVLGISQPTAISIMKKFKSIKSFVRNLDSPDLPKRVLTAMLNEKAIKFNNLINSYKLVSLYGLKKELKSDLSVTKSSKSPEIRLKQSLNFLKLFKFKSFLTKSGQNALKSLIN